MVMRQKVESILGGFLERNKEFAVSGYIRNGMSGNTMSDFLLSIDRKVELNEKKLLVKSSIGDMKYVNSISVPHDDVLACFEEVDEYNQQMVYVILKNSMVIEFECVGLVL